MRELSDVVLTRLVQVTVHMPGARWDPTALAEAEGVSEDEVHQVVRALRRAGLVDGVVTTAPWHSGRRTPRTRGFTTW